MLLRRNVTTAYPYRIKQKAAERVVGGGTFCGGLECEKDNPKASITTEGVRLRIFCQLP